MEQTAIKAGSPVAASPPHAAASQPKPRSREKSAAIQVLEAVASLRITVVLFVLSFFLVFFGTWAQKEAGIWTVVNDYFRSAYVKIPLRTLTMYAIYTVEEVGDEKIVHYIGGWIPYPGGRLLGILLLLNLLAAHAIRFKLSWNRSGIFLIHAGIILMMVGEFITGKWAIEGRMSIMEGNTSNHVEHERATELAIIDRSNPAEDKEIRIPQRLFDKGGVVADAKGQLPFVVEVVRYMSNSETHEAKPGEKNEATKGFGRTRIAVMKPETTGVDQEQRVEMHSAYVRLKHKDGRDLGTYLVSTWFTYLQRPMDEVIVDGKKYGITLRFERDYRDYRIQLLEFRHDKYLGTEVAKNFSSRIRLTDPSNKEDREITISMNNPLRYQGETFYQSGLHPLGKGTVLQVVRNPGWLLPYLSCIIVTLGMMVHFGMHLIQFLSRRLSA